MECYVGFVVVILNMYIICTNVVNFLGCFSSCDKEISYLDCGSISSFNS